MAKNESGKMSIVELDRKGRLILPKKMRESLGIGRKVLILNAGDHLKVIPLPSDPFEVLEGTLSLNKPFKELRKQAELTAEGTGEERS
jgi:bifunctional DNA-binding transcriptional regulator/antitoxin component of YhaV-PrlF toxin-antitoxin module